MALALRATLNLLARVFGVAPPSTNGLLLEDSSSFILLEDGFSVLELE